MPAPTLTDGVVQLDQFGAGDVDGHLANEDEEMARRFGWWPKRSTADNVRAAFDDWAESWASGGAIRAFAVRDLATPLLAGTGCTSVDAHKATCPAAGIRSFSADLGRNSDRAVVGNRLRLAAVVIRGGVGADTLSSVASRVVFYGGPGHDRLLGGPRADVLLGKRGADFIRGRQLAAYLNGRQIPGVRAYPIRFRPDSSNFAKVSIEGVRWVVTNRESFNAVRLGLEVAAALQTLYPGKISFEANRKLIGSEATLRALEAGEDPRAIEQKLEEPLRDFLQIREKYLLYR